MISALAYLGFTTPSTAAWPHLAENILGARVTDGLHGALRLQIDDAAWRVQLHPGETDAVAYIGWCVDDPADLAEITARLESAGIAVEKGTVELADERSVDQLIAFEDPWGNRHEVVWGQLARPATFSPNAHVSGFVTGEQGLGHFVLFVPDLEVGHRFFTETLGGFSMSDKIIVPGALKAWFYHCNTRHHTLALGEAPPGITGFHHMMFQVANINDVGQAWDKVQSEGVPIQATLGRHTNDQMLSFYIHTPSSFVLEYGAEAVTIGEDWTTRLYEATQIWGHRDHPSGADKPNGIWRPVAAAEPTNTNPNPSQYDDEKVEVSA